MDPVIDFGRELYIPWRITLGENPVKDYAHLYGPLSVYLNAAIFGVFGVGIRGLVVFNLIISCVVIWALFTVARRSFGHFPATVAVAFAIPCFLFPHYNLTNNYTFAAPYSHEATHGMMFLVLALVWLTRPKFHRNAAGGFVGGLLLGFCCLTKSEYILTAAGVWVVGLVRLLTTRELRTYALAWSIRSLLGGASTFVGAWVLLCVRLPILDAAAVALNAFIAPFSFGALVTSPLGLTLLGLDRPAQNLAVLGLATTFTIGLLFVVGAAARAVESHESRERTGMFFLGLLGAVMIIAWLIPWKYIASAFPGLLVGGMCIVLQTKRSSVSRLSPRQWNQLLWATAAGLMLARMLLVPRMHHYGFFQALLAGTWACAFIVGEWPRIAVRRARWQSVLSVAVSAMILICAFKLWQRSWSFYRLKIEPLGTKSDRIYGYGKGFHDVNLAWERARTFISANSDSNATLLVVPEGLMLNYWTRRKHPLWLLDLLPVSLNLDRGPVVSNLESDAPDVVVFISRDLKEFGFKFYGDNEASGRAIIEWMKSRYKLEAAAGEYPFQEHGAGVWLLLRQ